MNPIHCVLPFSYDRLNENRSICKNIICPETNLASKKIKGSHVGKEN